MGVASDIPMGRSLTANSLFLHLLHSFWPLCHTVPRALWMEMFCAVHWNWAPPLHLTGGGSLYTLPLLQ